MQSKHDDLDKLDEHAYALLGLFKVRKCADPGALSNEQQMAKLRQLLTCPICLDPFKDPVFIKKCSHRYCKKCIETSMRMSNSKQCPFCRKRIATKRELKEDKAVEMIIRGVFSEGSQSTSDPQHQQAGAQLLNREAEEKSVRDFIVIDDDGEADKKEHQIKSHPSLVLKLKARNSQTQQLKNNLIRISIHQKVKDLIKRIATMLNLSEEQARLLKIYFKDEVQDPERTLEETNKFYWTKSHQFGTRTEQPTDCSNGADSTESLFYWPLEYSAD